MGWNGKKLIPVDQTESSKTWYDAGRSDEVVENIVELIADLSPHEVAFSFQQHVVLWWPPCVSVDLYYDRLVRVGMCDLSVGPRDDNFEPTWSLVVEILVTEGANHWRLVVLIQVEVHADPVDPVTD